MREVACVVFVEIHYMGDKGILFEAAICQLIMLMNAPEIVQSD